MYCPIKHKLFSRPLTNLQDLLILTWIIIILPYTSKYIYTAHAR